MLFCDFRYNMKEIATRERERGRERETEKERERKRERGDYP